VINFVSEVEVFVHAFQREGISGQPFQELAVVAQAGVWELRGMEVSVDQPRYEKLVGCEMHLFTFFIVHACFRSNYSWLSSG